MGALIFGTQIRLAGFQKSQSPKQTPGQMTPSNEQARELAEQMPVQVAPERAQASVQGNQVGDLLNKAGLYGRPSFFRPLCQFETIFPR